MLRRVLLSQIANHDPTASDPPGLLQMHVTGRIFDAIYAVYDGLGFGFLESVYDKSVLFELADRKLDAHPELPINAFLNGPRSGTFRADVLFEKKHHRRA
jgi:hypothetical protein